MPLIPLHPFLKVNMSSPQPNPKEVVFRKLIRKAVGTRFRPMTGKGRCLYRVLKGHGYIEEDCRRHLSRYSYTGKPVEEEYITDENGSHLRDDDEMHLFPACSSDELEEHWCRYHLHLAREHGIYYSSWMENNPKGR